MDILEILGKIGFDWKLALANLINIAVIFFVLHKYAFKPIGTKLKERELLIKKGLAHAHQAEVILKDANTQKEEIIAQAKRDALLIINDANKERKQIIDNAHKIAEKEKRAILHKAQREIDELRKEMERDVETHAAELITAGVRKILKEEMTDEMNERIIRKVVNHD